MGNGGKHQQTDRKGHGQSHDLGVKRVLFRIYILKILCRMIFARSNKRLEDIIEWNSMEYAKGDTVDEGETRSDLAVNVNFKNSKYEAQIFLFFEHFSHPDPKVMPRLLTQHARFYAQDKDKQRLVLSVVISQGISGRPWDLPLSFQQYLEEKGILPKEYIDILGEYVVNLGTFFLDLQKIEISELNPILKPILYVFKYIKRVHPDQSKESRDEFLKDVYRLISDVAEDMKVDPEVQSIFEDLRRTSKEFASLDKDGIIKHIIEDELEGIILYLMQYNPDITKGALNEASKEVYMETGGRDYMNELDFTREGAKLQGIEIGRQEGLKSVILNMLKKNIDLSTIVECTGSSKDQVLELQKQAGL